MKTAIYRAVRLSSTRKAGRISVPSQFLTQNSANARQWRSVARDNGREDQLRTSTEFQSTGNDSADCDVPPTPYLDGGIFQPYVLSQQEIILSRARAYGIQTLEQLQLETEVDWPKSPNAKLIDRPALRYDLKLWRILLDHALLNSGSEGAQTIFNGLSRRGPPVRLVEDEFETTYIWKKLLDIAVQEPRGSFLRDLCTKESIVWDRPNLWPEVVGTLIRAHGPHAAVPIARGLTAKYRGKADLLTLYDILRPTTSDRLNSFLYIYSQFPADGMYASIASKLWRDNLPDLAFSMHTFLLMRHDFPRSFSDIEPLVLHLARTSADLEPFLRTLEATGIMFSVQARKAYEIELAEVAHTLGDATGRALGSHGKKRGRRLDDSTTARLFVTKAFSFEFVLNALRMLGVEEIGPQTLREIGLSSLNMQHFSDRIRQLDQLDLDTGGSAFSQLIRWYMIQGQHNFVHAALRSDMHVDVFGDRALQLELLSQSFREEGWPKVNLVLAMLTVGHNRRDSRLTSHELVMRAVIKAHAPRDLLKRLLQLGLGNLDNSSQHETILSWDTILLFALRFTEVNSGIRTAHQTLGRHRFLVAALQEFAILGRSISMLLWRKSLLTMAREGSFDEAAAIILWVAQYHSTPHKTKSRRLAGLNETGLSLSRLFDDRFQTAFLSYCVQRSFSIQKRRDNQRSYRVYLRQSLDWRRCLALLKRLEQEHNVQINVQALCKAVRLISGADARSDHATRRRNPRSVQFFLQKLRLIGAHATLRGIQELWPLAVIDVESIFNLPLGTSEVRRKQNILIRQRFLGRERKRWKFWRPPTWALKSREGGHKSRQMIQIGLYDHRTAFPGKHHPQHGCIESHLSQVHIDRWIEK